MRIAWKDAAVGFQWENWALHLLEPSVAFALGLTRSQGQKAWREVGGTIKPNDLPFTRCVIWENHVICLSLIFLLHLRFVTSLENNK